MMGTPRLPAGGSHFSSPPTAERMGGSNKSPEMPSTTSQDAPDGPAATGSPSAGPSGHDTLVRFSAAATWGQPVSLIGVMS